MTLKKISLITLLVSFTNMQPSTIHKEEHFIETSNAKIYYELFYTNESKGKMPIIGMHGGPGFNHDCMLPLVELASSNPVILYDQSGCGKSMTKDQNFSDWTLEYFTHELQELIDALKYEKVYLVGHSWGGTLATKYCLRYSNKVQQLILVSPVLSFPRLIEDCKKLAESLSPEFYQTLVRHETAGTMEDLEYVAAVTKYRAHFLCRINPWPKEMLTAMESLNIPMCLYMMGPYETVITGNLKNIDLVPELHTLNIPVVIICGQFDIVTPESMQYATQYIPLAQLVIIEDSAHMVQIEKPKEFIDAIRSFIPSTGSL